jgi:ABC-type lipoprotein export system ATPase subunit/uncharacterized protein YqgV (UPF0045/DUF77 family)
MKKNQQKLLSLKVKKLKNLIDLDIDFNIEHSNVTAILGPNGCGKSTILHLLASAYKPISQGEKYKFSNFFLPNTDAMWNDSSIEIINSYREGFKILNDKTTYLKSYRWLPVKARQPERDLFYIGVEKCVPMIELEKKQSKINYSTSEMDDAIFVEILSSASKILNKKYLRYNIHNASKKDFIGVEVEGLKYSALSMSAGEQKVFHILKVLFNAPKYSLILIDEFDLLLHDKAMILLVKVICERAKSKSIQVVFTTHRESIIFLSDLINIRHLFSTKNKTLCFNETSPDAINRLTGEKIKPLEIFVEDDLSKAIISKIASKLGGKRLVSIRKFGSATNCFTALSGLLFIEQDISNVLFVLDGDVYRSSDDKLRQLKKMISGTDTLSTEYRNMAINSISQYRLPCSIKPEPFLHSLICKIDHHDSDECMEIINAANEICVEDESHDYINKIIERLDLERSVGLSKIIDLVSTTQDWVGYVEDVSLWLSSKIEPLLECKLNTDAA